MEADRLVWLQRLTNACDHAISELEHRSDPVLDPLIDDIKALRQRLMANSPATPANSRTSLLPATVVGSAWSCAARVPRPRGSRAGGGRPTNTASTRWAGLRASARALLAIDRRRGRQRASRCASGTPRLRRRCRRRSPRSSRASRSSRSPSSSPPRWPRAIYLPHAQAAFARLSFAALPRWFAWLSLGRLDGRARPRWCPRCSRGCRASRGKGRMPKPNTIAPVRIAVSFASTKATNSAVFFPSGRSSFSRRNACRRRGRPLR